MSEILKNTGARLWSLTEDRDELQTNVFELLTGTGGKSNIRLIDEAIGSINDKLNGYYFDFSEEDHKLYICKKDENENIKKYAVSLTDDSGNIALSVDGETITIDQDGVLHGNTKIDIDSELSDTSTNPVENKIIKSELDDIKTALSTLNGDGEGSITKAVADAIAQVVADAPEDFDTLKEISDWISGHSDDAATMNSAIQENKKNIESLETGKADKSDLTEHIDNTDIHITSSEKNIVSKLGTSDDGNLTYNGEQIGGGNSIVISATQPTDQKAGDLWFVVKKTGYEDFTLDENTFDTYFGGIEPSGDVILKKTFTNDEDKYKLVKIGNKAFYKKNNITSIVIPNSVTELEDHVIDSCSSLKSITIPKSVSKFGWECVTECENIESIYWNCKLSNNDYFFDIFSSNVGKNAECTTIYLGDLVNEIPNIFSSTWDSSSNPANYIDKIVLNKNITKIPTSIFQGNAHIKEIDFNDSQITTINQNAFHNNQFLEEITIPDSVESIENGAFSDCKNLKKIKLSKNLKKIESTTFWSCISLEEITIPDSVVQMDNCFGGCTSLAKITLPISGVYTPYMNPIFEKCPNLTTIILTVGSGIMPDYIQSMDLTGLPWNTGNVTSLSIPSGVTVIGTYAFSNNTKLKTFYLPKTITEIHEFAFYDMGDGVTINYEGTEDQWNSITKEYNWNLSSTITINYNVSY